MNVSPLEGPSDPFRSPEQHRDDFQDRPPRSAWLAWSMIIVAIVLILWPHRRAGQGEVDEAPIAIQEIQAKYLVGAASFDLTAKAVNREQIETAFGNGGVLQRIIGSVLLGELVDNAAASKSLDELDAQVERGSLGATKRQREVLASAKKLYDERVNPQDETFQRTDNEIKGSEKLLPAYLGWAGKLALVPRSTVDKQTRARLIGQAKQTVLVVFGAFGLGIVGLLIGVVVQVLWWAFVIMGRVSSGIHELKGDYVVYAETFALWLLMMTGLSYLIAIPFFSRFGLTAVLIPQIGSLGAMAWPVFRGLRWTDVCEDIGLNFGRPQWAAPFFGVATYIATLPLIGAAMVVTIIMMQFASLLSGAGDGGVSPAHPIVEPIMRGTWAVRFQLMFVAVFAAVPEEIMFRGFFYRYLREAASGLGYIGRVAFAALVSSFIFAAIHPQGIMGIPILMSIALSFAMVREWRGSLVPSMVAHGLVNAGTTCLLFLVAD